MIAPRVKTDWLQDADRIIRVWIARYKAVAAYRKSLAALRSDAAAPHSRDQLPCFVVVARGAEVVGDIGQS